MDFLFSLLDKYGVSVAMLGVLCWYIWQKDKLIREQLDTLTKSVNRMTTSFEKLTTAYRERGDKNG